MSETTPEVPVASTYVDRLNEALVTFTGCIGEALSDICSYSLTVGESYVPFLPDEDDDCDDDEEFCSQVWVRVVSVNAVDEPVEFNGRYGPGSMALDIEVGVLRCFDVPEGGEAPTATDVLAGAVQAMEDMNSVYCAAMNCEVWEAIESGQWIPSGPTGGQYGGTWSFSVTV